MINFGCFFRLFACGSAALTFWSCTTTSPKNTANGRPKSSTIEHNSVIEVKNGLSLKVVDQGVTEQIVRICDCMEQFVTRTKQKKIESQIHFAITKAGYTQSVGIHNAGDKKLKQCLTTEVLAWSFPARQSEKKLSETEVKFHFKPTEHCKLKPPTGSTDTDANQVESSEMNIAPAADDKPVIYLYPPREMDVAVALEYDGVLTATYPSYDPSIKGWKVHAEPNGTLHDLRTGREYSYLFWEGLDKSHADEFSTGFAVKGDDVEEFLVRKLNEIGLMPREYNEFIVYWLPKLKGNPYNLIHFEGESYAERAKLTISPTPESVLRVMMLVRPLQKQVAIAPQEFPKFSRRGFTVIEWGGSLLPSSRIPQSGKKLSSPRRPHPLTM